MEIKPVAYIRTDFKEKFGIPRQSGRVPSLKGQIIFEPEYRNPDAVRGITDFSHLWLIFGFSTAKRGREALTARPPRLGGNTRIGVFATRAPYRPNSMGLSVVKLEKVEIDPNIGPVITVSGVDILDNTPIYDIKPYIPYADSVEGAVGGFADAMHTHALDVIFPQELLEILPADKRDTVIDCLKDDPRPSYHDDDRVYSMKFADFDIHFTVSGNTLTVTGIN